MRISKLIVLGAALLLVSGCTCRSKKVGPEEANIPVTSESVLKDVNFAFDSYKLDPKAQEILKANASWLNANAATKVQVEGHCDERGTSEYNMVLGANRARAAADYLRSLGVAGNRLSTVSYGKELPLDPAHNEAAWAKNRRAHFNIQK